MTEIIEEMSTRIDQEQLAQDLVEPELMRRDGLLTGLTKRVLETAAGGGDWRAPRVRQARPSRAEPRQLPYGSRAKSVLTQLGRVEVEVPRDRDGTFEPVIVRKRQRRLDGCVGSTTSPPRRTAPGCSSTGSGPGADQGQSQP